MIIKLNFSSENYKFEYDTFRGVDDENIGELSDVLLIKINMHDRSIRVKNNAPNSNILGDITHRMVSFIQENSYLTKELVREFCLDAMKKQTRQPNAQKNANVIKVRQLEPKTDGQRDYLDKIQNNDVVFGLGSPGTGKTKLAVYAALKALENGEVNKIVFIRPTVTAGSPIGYLPGLLEDKLYPFMAPVFNALEELITKDVMEKLISKDIIQILSIAYLRGITINSAICVIDEAQNISLHDMQLCMTRIGFGSKIILNGDVKQSDIRERSGVEVAHQIFQNTKGIAFHWFTPEDVVRSDLCKLIAQKFEEYSGGEVL